MTPKLLVLIFACLLFSGCWLTNRQTPLPQNETDFPSPTPKPVHFEAARKAKWIIDTLRPGHISAFDLDKLPSKRLNLTGFDKIKKPAAERPFNIETIPDTLFDLDKIPDEPLYVKTSLFGSMKKAALGQPKIRYESIFTSFQYSTEQGLPSSAIQATLHTRDGLVWIGTSGGLCVLNGSSMETFPNSFGTIFNLQEDAEGQVWLRSREFGVFIIDRKKGIQKQLTFNKAFNPGPGQDIRLDKKGNIWVSCFNNGIFLINPTLTSFKHLTSKNGLSSQQIMRTYEDSAGKNWILTSENGIMIIDSTLKKIKRFGKKEGLSTDYYFSIVEPKPGEIYLGNYHRGIDIISLYGKTLRNVDSAQGIPPSAMYSMLVDDEKNIWLGTDSSGVYILKHNADSIAHIGSAEGLGDDIVYYLDKDSRDQIWVGTLTGGINIFPRQDEVAHHLSKREGILDNEVWGMMTDSKNRLWVGTHSGVNLISSDLQISSLLPDWEKQFNRIQCFIEIAPEQYFISGGGGAIYFIDNVKKTLEKITTKEHLPSANILTAFKNSKGLIFLSTFDNGITILDPKTRIVKTLNLNGGLTTNRAYDVKEDANGNYWIAAYSTGIELMDASFDSLRKYSSQDGLSSNETEGITLDSKKRIWINTERALNLIDPDKMTNTIFSTSNGLPANGIYSLMENDSSFFVGTGRGLGLLRETQKGWTSVSYGRPQGFYFLDFNGNTQAHFKDKYWWGIIQGITYIGDEVFKDDSVMHSPVVTGIDILGKSQFFIDPGLIKDVDTLWNENKDSFYLSGTFAKLNSDREIGIEWDSLSPIYFPMGLSLPPNRNYLRFHFGDLLLQHEGVYRFMYILDGVDEKWSSSTDQPFSENYNNISPGNYTFRVAVKKGDGKWSEPSVYHFRIRPPWWQSWWAELIYLIAFITALRLWVRYRSRRLLKENALLEQKVTERTAELTTSLENLRQTQGQLIQSEKMASLGELTAGIAHEIQNPLNFVNNFSEVNTEMLEDVDKALEQGDMTEVKEILKDVNMNMGKITFHGKRADAIVKGMLLHSRASSGQKIPTDVNALADEYLRLSYHGLRAKDKSFNAQFTMDLDSSLSPVMLVQQDIGRVLLNIFNNAFYSVTEKKKLSPEGFQPTVTVSTRKVNNNVEIKIRDNGTGIPQKVIDKIYQPFFTTKPAGQGTGLGLSLSYDIITKEHSGKIDVVTKENEFTEFIIQLPAQSAA